MSYIPIQNFLAALHPSSPAIVDALSLNRKHIEHGLLPVGLKLHFIHLDKLEITKKTLCSLGNFMMALDGRNVTEDNYYRRMGRSLCLVLPPVGSAKWAVHFLECIERATGIQLFENPLVQIQVCTPGRLNNERCGLLTLGFYLGSDWLKEYDLSDLTTTFTEVRFSDLSRGQRITIYDGRGTLDRNFPFWRKRRKRGVTRKRVSPELPFQSERTDVLTATSRVDIENINLIASLLVHSSQGWYWKDLGRKFEGEMKALLAEHLLEHHLKAPWVRQRQAKPEDDALFLDALREAYAYVLGESVRNYQTKQEDGILYQTHRLLKKYRDEVVRISNAHDAWRRPT
jgi:hypothetical protein